tara:strand:- start:194 stop:469 length:276 start_codon:yes stop_codon:yes gene_type:complete
MPKKEKPVKKPVPIRELKSTPSTEVIEVERIVTPDDKLRVDHIFVRRQKICRGNPEEIFKTEEYARFDIAWPAEEKVEEVIDEEQKVEIKK